MKLPNPHKIELILYQEIKEATGRQTEYGQLRKAVDALFALFSVDDVILCDLFYTMISNSPRATLICLEDLKRLICYVEGLKKQVTHGEATKTCSILLDAEKSARLRKDMSLYRNTIP